MVNTKYLFLMDNGTISVSIGVLIIMIIAIASSYYFSAKNKVLRRLKKYSFKRVGLLKDAEYAKVKGKAMALEEPFVSPIGKKKCVYYEVTIDEKRSNGKTSHWHTIIKEVKHQDFILDTLHEKAIVNPSISKKNKRIYITKDVAYTSGTWNDAPKFLENYLQSHHKKSTSIFGLNKKIRYREGTIEVGEEIVVLGTISHQKTVPNFNRYSSFTVCISGDRTNKLYMTDSPKAIIPKN